MSVLHSLVQTLQFVTKIKDRGVIPERVPAGEGRGLCDGPSVVAEHDRWTVYSSKVNLPAALNDPRLAKRESDFFTKTWGLDFAETEVMPSFYLPNITREHFGPYLQETAQVRLV